MDFMEFGAIVIVALIVDHTIIEIANIWNRVSYKSKVKQQEVKKEETPDYIQ